MKSLFKYIMMGTFVLSVTASCTESFSDINTNHHQLTSDELQNDYQNIGAFFSQMQNRVVLFDDGSGKCLSSDYQVAQGLSSDPYSGYIGLSGTWKSGVHNGSYRFVGGWYNQMFTRAFSEVMPAWVKVKSAAKEQNQPAVGALADIIKVEALHRVTDYYGPIPYIHFGSGVIGTAYDKQEDIYKKFFNELDSAIDILTPLAESGSKLLPDYDNIYEGSVKNWVKFANTLRLRLAMRVVYADAGLAQQEAEKSAANSVGFIETSADRAAILHSKVTYFHPNYDMAYNFNAGEIRMSAIMDAYMNGYKDPRLAAYFKPAVNGGYHGIRLGVHNMAPAKYAGDDISNLKIDKSSTQIVWMTAAESFFLRAEGALRGWNMGGDAKTFYNKGIKASFDENGVTGADSYLANTTAKPTDYVDKTGDGHDMSAPSAITIAWDENADFETNLERIITQKWIALYPDGCEGWSEFRRTGYPHLFPVVNNDSNGSIDTQIQVRRCPFPTTEYNTNADAVKGAVATLNSESNNGKGDTGGTTLWWDKKSHE
ncbi:MAG: SusD/RagB family nutrient-binding outer membrane lipoprotein [Prevotella sp.]|jgi:hypothetical protein|nr:SusD/RagB family nutrient-binding outer membrane lipoprotein [Prevotella sp.]MCI1281839.1 SusD/RagB family nutrient-binding outer membrane lipoprotein [Prevotella sp.]